MVQPREALPEDAPAMSVILTRILSGWNSTRPGSPDHVLAHYIAHPDRIRCSVAEDDGQLLGFQSLKAARPGNPYDLPEGWGIIGTYVSTAAARRGVGKALFAETLAAAREAGLDQIDATIGKSNALGLAYYEAIGFRTYRTTDTAICKTLVL